MADFTYVLYVHVLALRIFYFDFMFLALHFRLSSAYFLVRLYVFHSAYILVHILCFLRFSPDLALRIFWYTFMFLALQLRLGYGRFYVCFVCKRISSAYILVRFFVFSFAFPT